MRYRTQRTLSLKNIYVAVNQNTITSRRKLGPGVPCSRVNASHAAWFTTEDPACRVEQTQRRRASRGCEQAVRGNGINCERNVCEEGQSKATGREKEEQGLRVREIRKIVTEIILRK